MINVWLTLPIPEQFLTLTGIYTASASLLILLCYNRVSGPWVQSFNGVVAPFFAGIVTILGILIGFLASDVWDRDRRAAAAVKNEAAALVSLYEIVGASGIQSGDLNLAIRNYASAVVEREWPTMENGEAASEAETAQDLLFETVVYHEPASNRGTTLDRLLLDIVLKVQEARSERLTLSADYSENFKWTCVLVFALIGQISLALVHLERARPQIAAMAVFTASIVAVIGVIAIHESPFSPPLRVSPAPIAAILKLVPDH